MRRLKNGQPLHMDSSVLNDEVRLWASYRFSALARTVRGVMYNQQALRCLARLNFPTETPVQIEQRLQKKFQLIIGYQPYMDPKFNDPDFAGFSEECAQKEALHQLMEKYPQIEVAYLARDRAGPSLQCVDPIRRRTRSVIVERERIQLPGTPILGQGKPENQVNMMRYVRMEKLQPLDMNQESYFEQEIKKWNVMERFRRNPNLRLIGLPERIVTAAYGSIAWFNAFADRTFVTAVQRVLSRLGVRFNYGHPDIWDFEWIKLRGGVSNQSKLNEDIFAGYMTVLQGGEIEHREELEEGKTREVSWNLVSMLFGKFGMGAGQQMPSREVYWFYTSPFD